MKHVLNILDLTVEEINELIETADDIIENPLKYSKTCENKQLATLFFEPSTRTRLSFESAMLALGGKVIGFSDPNSSSSTKGESVADTISVVSGYVDIIAMRHPKEGAPLVASTRSLVPIINAGDGGHYHPTQTLTDLLTISHEKGRLNNLTIGLCGDLKFGRTVHSLIEAMSRYTGIKFVLISPEELKLPEIIEREYITNKGIECVKCDSIEEAIGSLDILYMTRIQKERFDSEEEYYRLKDLYILTEDKMKLAKDDAIVLHPLPRVNEISTEVDADKRACYFKQAHYGRYMRMALIMKLLSESDGKLTSRLTYDKTKTIKAKCHNPHCITTTEQEIKQIIIPTGKEEGEFKCIYCDAKISLDE